MSTPSARILEGLEAIIDRVLGRRVTYATLYAAKVVFQHGDGTLDVVFDDTALGSCQGVPIRYGLPWVRVEVPAETRVLVAFEGADPRGAVVVAWDGPASLVRFRGGSARVSRVGDSVACGTLVVTAAAGQATLTYNPPGGGTPQVVILGGLPGITGGGTFTLAGRITTGAEGLEA